MNKSTNHTSGNMKLKTKFTHKKIRLSHNKKTIFNSLVVFPGSTNTFLSFTFSFVNCSA
jgi:hypothetical protein